MDTESPPKPDQPVTTELLIRAVSAGGEKVTLGEIVDALDSRSFGIVILLFSIPSIIPMPPGIPTMVGIALLIVSSQMAFGREDLWLPGFISRASFGREQLVGGFRQVQRWMGWLERLTKPRLLALTGKLGSVLIGFVVVVMAIVLILPLPPGGNFPPALACAVLGMGLAQRDGLLVLAGLIVTAIAGYLAFLLADLLIKALPGIFDWFGGLFGWA